MTRFGYVAAACGLAGLLSAGAVAVSRAQQPEGRSDPPAARKQKARERLIQIRTEVELLQIEHEADRADLLQTMNDLRKLRRDGLSREEEKVIVQTADQFQAMKAVLGEKELASTFDKMGEKVALELKEAGATIEEVKAMDRETLARFLAGVEIKVTGKKLGASIEERKKSFTRLAAELNRKTLERDEAERQYKSAD